MELTRRDLLRTTAMVPVAAAAAACSGTSQLTALLPEAVAAFQSVGQEVALLKPLLPAGISLEVVTDLTDIENVASAITLATPATQGASTLVQIEGDINAAAPIILPIISTLNPGIGAGLGLVVAALPALEGLLNVGLNMLSSTAKSLASNATATTARRGVSAPLTPQLALDILLRKHGYR